MHAHCISWAHMCTVQYNLLVYGGIQIVLCVWACVCVVSQHCRWHFSVHFTLSCKTSLTPTPVCFCYKSSVIWPVCSVRERERERDGFPLLCVCRRDTSRLHDETQCTNGSREGVCAASADWKSSFNSLAWRHTRSLPTIHLQGFSFTIDRHYMQDAGMKNYSNDYDSLVAIKDYSNEAVMKMTRIFYKMTAMAIW